MSLQTFAALIRGQVALGIPRAEAEDVARFVTGTLSAAQQGSGNEKATVAPVASDVLSKHKLDYADLSTKELRTQVFCPTNSQSSPLFTPESVSSQKVAVEQKINEKHRHCYRSSNKGKLS